MQASISAPLRKAFADKLSGLKESDGPIQLAIEVQEPSIIEWLNQRAAMPRWFWSDRSLSQQVAACGQVQAWNSLHAVQQFLQQAPREMRCYGGWGFDQYRQYKAPWQHWPSTLFVLPRWELRQLGDYQLLCVNLLAPSEQKSAELETAFDLLKAVSQELTSTGALSKLHETPDQAAWHQMLAQAQTILDQGHLQKVVLSRETCSSLAHLGLDLMQRLIERKRQAYHFWFQPQAGEILWGASPERLYARQGRLIQTEALAGTRPLPNDSQAAELFRQELLHSPKEQQENERVQQHLESQLSGLTEDLLVRPLTVVQAGPVQHLYRQLEGRLHLSVRDTDLKNALHPTPAVSGYPSAEAMAVLQALEPHERGWYTGALGWVSHEAAEWCVTLRAALWSQDCLHFYTGAGIMPESDPAAEWQELEAKLLSLKTLFY